MPCAIVNFKREKLHAIISCSLVHILIVSFQLLVAANFGDIHIHTKTLIKIE